MEIYKINGTSQEMHIKMTPRSAFRSLTTSDAGNSLKILVVSSSKENQKNPPFELPVEYMQALMKTIFCFSSFSRWKTAPRFCHEEKVVSLTAKEAGASMKTLRAQRKISHACRMHCFVDGKTFPAYMHLFHPNDKTSDLRAPLYVMIDLEVALMSSMGADFPKPRQILFLVMPFIIEMTKTSS